MVGAHVIVVCSSCFPQTIAIAAVLSRWNFSQSLNYLWQIMHGTRCGGLYLFFVKSKSPVGEPSVKLSAGCAYNTVLLNSLLLWGMSYKQGPSLRIRLAEDPGNKAWETGQLLKLSYLLSKVPGKASFKWCSSFFCAALRASQAASLLRFHVKCWEWQMEETVVSHRASFAGVQA